MTCCSVLYRHCTVLLLQLVDLIRAYCNGEFSEDVVKGNFVLIYELLDEVGGWSG